MISDRTLELIEEFRRCQHWFGQLGAPPIYDTVVQAESLVSALRMYHSTRWRNICTEASNGLSMRLDRDFLDRYSSWNEHVSSIDEVLVPIIDPIVLEFIDAHPEIDGLRETFKLWRDPDEPVPQPHECLIFRQTTLSALRMACLEAEYSDIIPLAFFSEMSAWYLAGHLPCGLTDEYPNGKLVIY